MKYLNAAICLIAGLICCMGAVALSVGLAWYVLELRGAAMFGVTVSSAALGTLLLTACQRAAAQELQ